MVKPDFFVVCVPKVKELDVIPANNPTKLLQRVGEIVGKFDKNSLVKASKIVDNDLSMFECRDGLFVTKLDGENGYVNIYVGLAPK